MGLGGLWKEAVQAKRVLQAISSGEKVGYSNHPQLDRFKKSPDSLQAINSYLLPVWQEACHSRGYKYNANYLTGPRALPTRKIPVTEGQVAYEIEHLKKKLIDRDDLYRYNLLEQGGLPELNPIFELVPGEIESWEKL